ncbi:MAG: hypothetical protein D6796_03930 [Caldilineae bacterium]|nr:MAG: hypothetical protein D6796_03930 [Caldilineae bacterium]
MNMFTVALGQLAGQSLLLLVYLVGIVLALVFWRRYPRPCAFTLGAMGLLLLTTIGQTVMTFYFAYRFGPTPRLIAGSALVSTLIRAVAFGLLLAAIFVDREPRG